METIKLKCETCGGVLTVDKERSVLSCPYCQSQELVVESDKIVIEKIKSFTKKDIQKDKQDHELNKKKLAFKHSLIGVLIGVLLFVAFVAFCIFMMYYTDEVPDKNELAIPMSSNDYEGDNYKQVVKLLENAGFQNVETSEVTDLITGWITKDGEVDRVSINGDYDFDEGDIFPKDATVVVTYHTFKK